MHAMANALSEFTTTPVDARCRANSRGNTPSSAMAYITRGLLISRTFT